MSRRLCRIAFVFFLLQVGGLRAQEELKVLRADLQKLELERNRLFREEERLLKESEQFIREVRQKKREYYKEKGLIAEWQLEKMMGRYVGALSKIDQIRSRRWMIEKDLEVQRLKFNEALQRGIEHRLQKAAGALKKRDLGRAEKLYDEVKRLMNEVRLQEDVVDPPFISMVELTGLEDLDQLEVLGALTRHDLEFTEDALKKIQIRLDQKRQARKVIEELARFQGISGRGFRDEREIPSLNKLENLEREIARLEKRQSEWQKRSEVLRELLKKIQERLAAEEIR